MKKKFLSHSLSSIFIFSEISWLDSHKNIRTLHIRAVEFRKRFCSNEQNIALQSE